jgi:hypothetical protein
MTASTKNHPRDYARNVLAVCVPLERHVRQGGLNHLYKESKRDVGAIEGTAASNQELARGYSMGRGGCSGGILEKGWPSANGERAEPRRTRRRRKGGATRRFEAHCGRNSLSDEETGTADNRLDPSLTRRSVWRCLPCGARSVSGSCQNCLGG